MVTSKWFEDVYCPGLDSDATGHQYILGGYTTDRNTPIELMGAVKLSDGSYQLFWSLYGENRIPSSINHHKADLGWQLPDDIQEALYGTLFGGESGWEWDIIGDLLRNTSPTSDKYRLIEVLPSSFDWDKVKARLVEVGEQLTVGLPREG